MSNRKSWESPEGIVDIVLLTLKDEALHVVLLKRDREPHKGKATLVGGFVHTEEDADLDATVSRILHTKAGLNDVFVEQLYTFGSSTRDARGWSISVTYLALVPLGDILASGAAGLRVIPVEEASGLPFDHDAILAKALERLRSKGSYSVLPARLLPASFTMSELQHTYELVMGKESKSGSSFRRKMLELKVIEETGEKSKNTKRPSELYRLAAGASVFDRTI